jgi:hypothetical protein
MITLGGKKKLHESTEMPGFAAALIEIEWENNFYVETRHAASGFADRMYPIPLWFDRPSFGRDDVPFNNRP